MVRGITVYGALLIVLYGAGTSPLYDNCTSGYISGIRDGFCDSENNNEECGYDGGDCCGCTTVETWSNNDYLDAFCLDPNSGCVGTRVNDYPNCTDGYIPGMGDGSCDWENNNKECDYDGGDCCDCNTHPDESSSMLCVDPNDNCYSLAAVALHSDCNDGDIPTIGDGYCNLENNNNKCTYDGGDCCDCSSFSLCVDPSHACYDPTAVGFQSRCTNGTIEDIGDGLCDMKNNNEECLFDGGDCCICTCTHGSDHYCGENGFTCLDYYIDQLEPYVCVESPPSPTSCDSGATQEWIVESGAQARALAEAVRCPGGSFNVTWKGNVIVNETISIFDGTFVNVLSGDGDAAVVGDGKTRLFSVVNASLHLRDITIRNGAALYGGAIAALRSSLSFDRVAFIGNMASNGGGAMYVSNNTIVSFSQRCNFFNNSAFEGGALYVTEKSNVSWRGDTTLSDNTVTSGGGGALYVSGGSHVSWRGNTMLSENVARSSCGGALYVSGSSRVSWRGNTMLSDNVASSWNGGALYMSSNSLAIWTGKTTFSGNVASYGYGGALYMTNDSSVLLRGNTTIFFNNTADYGGALYLKDGNASWTTPLHFLHNSAENEGGALYIYNSNVTWTAASTFSANVAGSDGGAVYATYKALLLCNDTALFVKNSAQNGGALFLTNDAVIELGKGGSFISNHAISNGGALASEGYTIYSSYSTKWAIVVKGDTSFVNNTCGTNGGAMSLVQSLPVLFDGDHIAFLENSAGCSGGAVSLEDSEIGTVFRNVLFLGNSAQGGGGVYAMASGEMNNPTTFDNCNFTRNAAFTTGGAVDSSSGQDLFSRTLFKDNQARIGGALRLAGTASIDNCSFNENHSKPMGGPALYNAGSISNMTNISFNDNAFSCEFQMILEFYSAGDMFTDICANCPDTCVGCNYGETHGSPTCIALSEKGVYHARSEGDTTTIENILIDEGYWRATSKSTKVLECYNMQACKGGVTGALDYCHPGYDGPYCSVCRNDYGASLSFTCRKCSNRTVDIVVVAVLTVLALAVGLAIVKYLMTAEVVGADHGFMHRVTQRVPIPSVKIMIVLWQILTQFASVASVTFPDVYQTFLDSINVINFDLTWVMSFSCLVEIDFHDRLLWTTITPIVILCLLGGTYAIAVYSRRGSTEATRMNIRHKHTSMALFVAFLVYSSVSSVVFQMFACDDLDDGKRYLRADYRIQCDSFKHQAFQIYAGLMFFLYPVGIPVLYARLLFSNRHILQVKQGRKESLEARSTSDLWKPYKPLRFYYEVIECARRISLTGIVVFIYPNTAAQITATFTIAVVFGIVSEGMAPYESSWDTWISRMSHGVLFVSMCLALFLKVDVSGENDTSKKLFGVILVAAHGGMILAVVVEALIMAIALRAGKQVEDARPRPRYTANISRKMSISLVEEDNCKVEL